MNLDDLLCVGATDRFLLTSVINRNKKYIPGEVIAEIISGTQEFLDRMSDSGIHINLMGGETADLGDIVRTVTVDAAMTVRMRKSDLVLTPKYQTRPCNSRTRILRAGHLRRSIQLRHIEQWASPLARHDVLSKYYAERYPESYDKTIDAKIVYSGSKKVTDALDGTPLNIGQALLSPTRTFAPVIRKVLSEMKGQIHGLVNCTGGAQTKVLHYIEGLRIVKDNLLPIAPIFDLIQRESQTDWQEMYKVLNCGTRLEVYIDEKNAANVIAIATSFGIDAQVIAPCRGG